MQVYRVLGESGVLSRLEVASARGLTPLVGRDSEVTLLLERWEQVKDGAGQVVLLSGEAGIGKSRLVQALKDQVAQEPHTRVEYRCSPYHQHSAFAPIIAHIERVLAWNRDAVSQEKLRKLEDALVRHPWPLPEVVPPSGCTLSLPLLAPYLPLTLTPERQKQKPSKPCWPGCWRRPSNSPCSSSSKTCTGWIRPRWSGSAWWWSKARRCACTVCSPAGPRICVTLADTHIT